MGIWFSRVSGIREKEEKKDNVFRTERGLRPLLSRGAVARGRETGRRQGHFRGRRSRSECASAGAAGADGAEGRIGEPAKANKTAA